MRRGATRRPSSTSESAVARRAARVSKDIATSMAGFGSGIRSGIATMARAKGKVSARTVATPKVMTVMANTAKVTARTDTQARGAAKEGEAIARAACGRLVLGVGQRVEEDIPEILFIGNVQNNGTLEGWKMMPMKVTLGVFEKDSCMVPIQKTQIGQTVLVKNRFKVLEVDDVEEETISRYLRWTMLRRRDEEVVENSVACGLEGSKAQERVQFVTSVNKDEGWLSLGVGDIILDSAADESSCHWRGEMFSRRRKARGRCC